MGILSEADNIIAGNRYIITTTKNESLIIKSMAQLLLLHDQIEHLNSAKADAVRADITALMHLANETLGTEISWAAEAEESAGAENTNEVGAWNSWLNAARDNPVPVFASMGAVAAAWALATAAW